jgi:uncharacterized protein YndB with AHSA1/START domain
MPSASVIRIIAAPAHDIWSVLSDIENAPRWNPSWKKIEIISTQTHGSGTRFRAQVDEKQAFDFEVAEWVVPELISFTPIRDPMEPLYSITLEGHAFRLSKIDERTTNVELFAYASTHGFRGIVMGLFMWAGHQKPGLSRALDHLQALFEPDKVVIEDEELKVLESEADSK